MESRLLVFLEFHWLSKLLDKFGCLPTFGMKMGNALPRTQALQFFSLARRT